jgi:hypothetical protein
MRQRERSPSVWTTERHQIGETLPCPHAIFRAPTRRTRMKTAATTIRRQRFTGFGGTVGLIVQTCQIPAIWSG